MENKNMLEKMDRMLEVMEALAVQNEQLKNSLLIANDELQRMVMVRTDEVLETIRHMSV